MVSNISYKLSAFADYTNISCTSENIMKIISAFKGIDFLPNVISEMLSDGNVSQRIQLRIASGGLSVTILSERIDIELSSGRKEGFSADEKKSLQKELYQMLSTVYQVFDEVIPIANRVAWFVSYVLFEIGDNEKQEYINRFLKKPAFYQANSTDDLLVRFSGREESLIAGRKENINVITTISRLLSDPGAPVEIDGYKIDFDINTWQENRKNRFDCPNIEDFIAVAYGYQNKLEADFIK